MSAAADNPPHFRCVLWHPPGAQLPGDLLTSLSRRIPSIAVCSDPFSVMAELCAARRPEPAANGQPPHAQLALVLTQPDRLPDLAEVLSEIRTYAPDALCWKFDERANPKLSAVVDSDVATWLDRGASAAAATAKSEIPPRTNDPSAPSTSSPVSSPFVPAAHARSAPATPSTRTPQATPAVAAFPPLRLTTDETPPTSGRPTAPEVVVRPQPARSGPRNLTLRGEGPTAPAEGAPPAPPRPILTPEEMRMLLGDDPIEPPSDRGGTANGRHPNPPASGPERPGGPR